MAIEKTITLKWKPVKVPDLAGYFVYWSPFKGVWTLLNMPIAKSTTSLKLTMHAGANYYFAVAAYDLAGNVSKLRELKV